MSIDFTAKDATGAHWSLSDHLDSAAVITFHRGDFWTYCHGQLAVAAQRQGDFNAKGARVYGLSADSPGQNSAVMEKLALPFAILSDETKENAIIPLGFDDEDDPRQISKPGVVVITPDAEVAYRYVGRDYADRPDEADVLADLEKLGLDPTTQERDPVGPLEPSEKAMPGEGLRHYFSGAKFANLALRKRHRELGKEFADDTKRYVQMIERYLEALSAVEDRKG